MEQGKVSFDELWLRAEAEGYASKLSAEYPAWRHRRHVRRTALASVAIVIVAGFSLFNFHFSSSYPSERVYCNNAAFSDSHWTEMASTLLIEV